MTDEELIARLRYEANTDGYDYHGDLHEKSADRIEALIEQLAAAQDDAKEAEAYAGEVEREQKGWQEAAVKLMNKLTTSEAKLAKAVEALEQCEIMLRLRGHDEVAAIARTTLAEIKGESQDGMV